MFTNTSQQLAEKKLLLLYIFDKLGKPLTNTEITHFVLENDIMNYFMLHQFLVELQEAKFLMSREDGQAPSLYISQKGKDTLNYFINHIGSYLKERIDNLILDRASLPKNKPNILANYSQLEDGLYRVNLAITQDGNSLIDLKLKVDDIDRVREIQNKWLEEGHHLYHHILGLFTNK